MGEEAQTTADQVQTADHAPAPSAATSSAPGEIAASTPENLAADPPAALPSEEIDASGPIVQESAPDAGKAPPASPFAASAEPTPAPSAPTLEAVPDLAPDAAELLKRVSELEGSLSELRGRHREQLDQQRADLLVKRWGLKDQYLKFAPPVDSANPSTDEGRAALEAWRAEHRELFATAPTLEPTPAEKLPPAAEPPSRFRKRKTWGSLFGN